MVDSSRLTPTTAAEKKIVFTALGFLFILENRKPTISQDFITGTL
jgi:hypothetical protein